MIGVIVRVRLHTSDETANRYDLWTYGCHAIRYRNWMKEVYVNIISTVKGMDSGINSTKSPRAHEQPIGKRLDSYDIT